VISHRTGRRDLIVYNRRDPDAAQEVVRLTSEESDTLAELLGSSRVVARLAQLQQQVEGLAIDWLPIVAGSPYAGGTIADTQARTRTGVSIIAVLHSDTATPAPQPDFRFQVGDTLVVVGTTAGIRALSRLLGT
jgi:TrkA domain protein